jgi:hypothetical protein
MAPPVAVPIPVAPVAPPVLTPTVAPIAPQFCQQPELVLNDIHASGDKNGFAKGDAVKIVGLKATNMNGLSAVVEEDAPMPGGRIQIRLSEREPGTLKSIKPENLKKIQTFQSGQVVTLTDLENKSMNGKSGMVVDSSIPGGRITVRLYEGKTVSVKLVADILD